MSKKANKLYIVCGHGAGDSGAVGHGYREDHQVRALANQMRALAPNDVVVCNQSINFFKDASAWRTIPKGSVVLELHMDSYSNPDSKGGHVIIKKGIGGPDQWDIALSNYIAGRFPGRSSKLVERENLSNPTRAYNQGLNYRLLETCFISNKGDADSLAGDMVGVATGILGAFNVPVKQEKVAYRVVTGFNQEADAKKLQSYLMDKGYKSTRIERVVL